ncbi:MAG: helix-turn-helix transcriptional regulator [Planctomycetes bacterium]|nr:helix-turn-helix transcriptional regulator [Planctomycetota bacterium]
MTQDAIKILERMVGDDAELQLQIQLSDITADIAEQVYEARTERSITQTELAVLIGTSQSAVARVENADYDGHSIRTLVKIANALKFHVQFNLAKEEDERPIQVSLVSEQSRPSEATESTNTIRADIGETNEQITNKETNETQNPLAYIGPSTSSGCGLADSN